MLEILCKQSFTILWTWSLFAWLIFQSNCTCMYNLWAWLCLFVVIRLTSCDLERKSRFMLYALQLTPYVLTKRDSYKRHVTLLAGESSQHCIPVIVSNTKQTEGALCTLSFLCLQWPDYSPEAVSEALVSLCTFCSSLLTCHSRR